MKKAAKYGRYSCDRQDEQSIDGQFRVIEDFAARNDIEIVATYEDKAMTGTNDNRPQFQQMLKDSDRKEWDYVLVYRLDRFSRNKYEMAIHRKHLKDNGIKILSVMENIPDSPEGILLESLLEGMNQYYSEELSQKTKRGMNETRLKGNFIGGIINYGWSLKTIYIEENGKQTPIAKKVILNEDEAPIVKEIFTEYASGKKAIDIARDFAVRGIRNRGKVFQRDTIYSILRQEKYTGIYRVNGMAYDKIYPPIIPIELYNVVKKRIDANKYGKQPKHNIHYLLKGRIYCGYCGKRMTSFTGTSKSGKVNRYYRCHKLDFCPQSRTVKKDVLEQAIIKTIQQMLLSEDNFTFLLDKILESYNSKLNDLTALRLAEKDLTNVEKSLSNLVAAIEAGLLTETTRTRLNELEMRKTELKEIIAKERTKEIKPINKSDVAKYIKTALSQPTQAMIEMLVEKAIIKDNIIELYLKYTNDTPPITPERGRPKKSENPERSLSERGFLFIEYTYDYETSAKGRKPLGYDDRHGEIKTFKVQVFV